MWETALDEELRSGPSLHPPGGGGGPGLCGEARTSSTNSSRTSRDLEGTARLPSTRHTPPKVEGLPQGPRGSAQLSVRKAFGNCPSLKHVRLESSVCAISGAPGLPRAASLTC